MKDACLFVLFLVRLVDSPHVIATTIRTGTVKSARSWPPELGSRLLCSVLELYEVSLFLLLIKGNRLIR